jgi:prepilin-type N-terminal cleavage/methylation domain-containing protein
MKKNNTSVQLSHGSSAFTLLELLAVMVVLTLLAVTGLPALSHTRNRSQDAIDFYNNKQLMAAANMYASEHNDTLPGCGWGTANDAWAYSKNVSGGPGRIGKTVLELDAIVLARRPRPNHRKPLIQRSCWTRSNVEQRHAVNIVGLLLQPVELIAQRAVISVHQNGEGVYVSAR